ncbi:MAG: hypothetical protein ACI3VN_05780 [Candidatus Onthomonas sp.]
MKGYREYMDRQQVSPALHDRLLALEQQQKAVEPAQPPKYWKPVLAMAACVCLVLGMSWGRSLFSSSDSAASTVEYAMDAAAQEALEEEAADEAISETASPSEDAGAFFAESASAADKAEAEDSIPSEETFEEDASEDAMPESALAPPEDALLPGWLPEGYSLTAVETGTDAHCYRLIWSDGTEEIILEYAYAPQPPEELPWPVYDREAADWETVSQEEEQDGVWGFCLYDKDLICWQCFTTTGDHETLWKVAQSMTR